MPTAPNLRRNPVQANMVGPVATSYTQQQAMIMEAFRSQEYIQDQMDVQAEPIYDTLSQVVTNSIIEGTSTATFFTDTANKTLNLTNMTQPRQLPNPEALAIYCYRYYIDPRNTVADCEAVLAQFAFQFRLGRKDYQTLPLWMIPQGGGLDFQGTDTDVSILHNGRPTKEAIRPIAITLVLEQGVNFQANLIGPTYVILGATFIHAVILDGLHARGIQ